VTSSERNRTPLVREEPENGRRLALALPEDDREPA
jgi:hypothetical protein